MNHTVTHRFVDRAVLHRVMTAVGMAVVMNAVDVLANHVLWFPAEHTGARRVDEGRQPVTVDAVDTVAYRAEQQLIVALRLLKQIKDVAPLNQPAAHGAFGMSLVAVVLLLT